MSLPTGTDLSGIDVTDPSLYTDGIPHAVFARLRAEHPVWWNPQPPGIGGFDDSGFWAVSTNELVRQVSRDGETFSSWENTATIRYADGCPRENIESARSIMLNKDAPEHTALRQIVSRGFTPRAIATLREGLAARARDIVARAAEAGSGNFVDQVATELPLQAIADIIGVPQAERRRIFDWSTTMTGREDPDVPGDPLEAMGQVAAYAMALAAERRARPADDIVTTLVRAQDDAGALTDAEFGSFLVLLMVAGTETTRDAVAQGLLAFQDNPGQWDLFRRERPATAVDEIVRWASPVMSFQRTATRDVELGGQAVRRGDRLVMLYAAANFDEAAFTDPLTFDITRSPNPHVGFGGTGPHYCLGNNLARMEIELIFGALADAIPDITVTGPAVRTPSGWLNGLKSVPAEYPACPVAH